MACALASERKPDLILMDIQLPGHQRHRGVARSCGANPETRDDSRDRGHARR